MEQLKRTTQKKHTERVLQFGEGNFLRGFADWMIDRLNKEAGTDLGVAVVQPIPTGNGEKLNEQGGLYTLYLRGLQNGEKTEETRVVDCITRCVDPYRDREEFFALAENPELRFVLSNTTEAGIEYREGPEDFFRTTFPGRLAMFLKRRLEAGLPGFLFLPCELIDRNGDELRSCVLRYGELWGYGEEFSRWVREENHFTNTLVDRIVTGYPRETAAEMEEKLGYRDAALDTAEIFHLWVIQGDRKYAGELPFDRLGLNVLWTDDVTPYKKRKVRILNGAHTMSVPAARLMGLETVGEMMEDETVSAFLQKGLGEEIIPVLDLPREELEGFARDVLERFRNPFIRHYLLSIALNSVSKFRVRVLPTILEYREQFGRDPECLLFSLAALLLFYRTEEANDDPEILTLMKSASPGEILSREDLWGTDLSFLLPRVEHYLARIEEKGMRQTMRELL